MRVEQYFQSLTAELEALKDRVRYLLENRHGPTVGEWRESVLRQVLRRHLPNSVVVGRGFVVNADQASTQLDVLIYDGTKPLLFRDGDLAIVTPDAVCGIIEVKSRVNPGDLATAVAKLATAITPVRLSPNSRAFAGLFAFESDGGTAEAYLRAVGDAADGWNNRVDFVCVGPSRFIRYWNETPDGRRPYEAWRSYALPKMAPGYFLHNVVQAVNPISVFSNQDLWFPPGGKESYCDGEFPGKWQTRQPA